MFYLKKEKVLSPTFSIVNIYNLGVCKIWHYRSLYRLQNKNEIFNLDYQHRLCNCQITNNQGLSTEKKNRNSFEREQRIFKERCCKKDKL